MGFQVAQGRHVAQRMACDTYITLSIGLLYHTDEECRDPMGLQSGQLTNDQITASTYEGNAFSPHNGRLNGSSSWNALTSDGDQFLEVSNHT